MFKSRFSNLPTSIKILAHHCSSLIRLLYLKSDFREDTRILEHIPLLTLYTNGHCRSRLNAPSHPLFFTENSREPICKP